MSAAFDCNAVMLSMGVGDLETHNTFCPFSPNLHNF
jgi:hypothetical protein